MALTMWTNVISEKRLDTDELAAFRVRAHRLYEANESLFEDESEALSALGVVSAFEAAADRASWRTLRHAVAS
ncbi:MAG: hypothetical protein QOD72_1522 [Acidimicrobiaceae bacterium]|jgi:hypothetical protein|nr:hypothetical protein [Acidimicrobiaceae bacterium]